jgi:hypothetical protein
MTEYRCTEHSTHSMGCQCHEARRDAEVARLKEKLAVMREGLEFYASGKMESSDPYCSVWEGWDYSSGDKRPIKGGTHAREAIAKADAIGKREP